MSMLAERPNTEEPTELLLSKIEDMKLVIQKATSHVQVMEIRDHASALARLMKTRKESIDHVNAVMEVKLASERRMGDMLAEKPENRGHYQKSHDVTFGDSVSLADIGVSKMQSCRWQAVASIDDDIYEAHIRETKQAGKELTTSAVLKLAKRLKAAEDCKPSEQTLPSGPRIITNLQQAIDRGQKFGTIYADPPWRYGNQGTRGATDDHYVTMSIEEICAEPVSEIVADSAHLHLWTTNAFLREAFDVIKAWGFEYKSCFVWVKPQMGMGNYWRVSHEFLLLGVRGSCPFGSRDDKSWMSIDRLEHSEKPGEIRQVVERVSPGPHLEMYGREIDLSSPWTVYGNQVEDRFPLYPPESLSGGQYSR